MSANTKVIGRLVETHTSIGSTNDEARRRAKEGAPDGTMIVAMEQTGGRGRRGRTWHSPPGAGLYVSFILRPSFSPDKAPIMTLMAAVALRRALIKTCNVDLQIKWPNDLLAHGSLKKVAGILAELDASTTEIHALILGLGLNLLEVEWPEEIAHLATSVEALANEKPDRAKLLSQLCWELENLLGVFERKGPAPILDAFSEAAAGRGETVEVRDGDEQLFGKLKGVSEDGALLLDTGGEVRRIYAADLLLPGAPRPR